MFVQVIALPLFFVIQSCLVLTWLARRKCLINDFGLPTSVLGVMVLVILVLLRRLVVVLGVMALLFQEEGNRRPSAHHSRVLGLPVWRRLRQKVEVKNRRGRVVRRKIKTCSVVIFVVSMLDCLILFCYFKLYEVERYP